MTDNADGPGAGATPGAALIERLTNGLEDVQRLQDLGGWITDPNGELETMALPPGVEHSKQWPDGLLIKAKWGEGPWILEPDCVIFHAKAAPHLRGMVWRHFMWGQLNGYVLVPQRHLLPGISFEHGEYQHLPTTGAHRGLTYASRTDAGNWVLGFHTGHAWDYQPAFEARSPSWLRFPRGEEQPEWLRHTYRDMPYVRREVEQLAADIATAVAP